MKTRLKVVATPEPTTLVDQLGRVKAKIATLKMEEENLKQLLADSGISEADGRLFHCTIARYTKPIVDYKGLLLKLKASARLVASYTRESDEIVAVTVTARAT